jgi:hypothetical protein
MERWQVKDANGVIFWKGDAADRSEAEMLAERSRAGVDGWPPEPWRAEQVKS